MNWFGRLHRLRNLYRVSQFYEDMVFNQAWLARRVSMLEQGVLNGDEPDNPLTCRVAKQSDCSDDYQRWMVELGQSVLVERKLWEWSAIGRALEASGCLAPGKRGLGFAVGTEPLAAAFAARGCRITATDLDMADPRASEWAATNQHFSGTPAPGVDFRPVDMNSIPADLADFDFVWSACAMEHLGDLEAGLRFVENSMNCLRPGGWAIHTTEYNLGSETETIERGPTVFYRRADIQNLADRLERVGHRVQPFGALEQQWGGSLDAYIDIPPYQNVSLQLRSGKLRSTSLIMITRAHG
jgi:2-polyprenyl-3-methyl-5-hydroxy-6-metoxy-1,4-benzoquinol methylase